MQKSPRVAVISSDRTPVGFWRRALAFVLDAVVVDSVVIPVVAVLFCRPMCLRRLVLYDLHATLLTLAVALAVLGAVVRGLYFTLLTGLRGKTVGKAIVGAEVIQFLRGVQVGNLRSLGRWLAYLISALPLGYGFVRIAVSDDKRGLHDCLAGTQVVFGDRSGSVPMMLLCTAALAFSIIVVGFVPGTVEPRYVYGMGGELEGVLGSIRTVVFLLPIVPAMWLTGATLVRAKR